MENTPLISVIVPVYNVEKYLKKCVNSICNQTYENLEIILIDDGSTDNSGLICDELSCKDNRIVVIHQNNGGQATARNMGLSAAKGEFIGFVDSDDWIEPKLYETMLSIIQNHDIAICGHRKIHEEESVDNNYSISPSSPLSNDELWDEVFGRLNNAVWNKLYRKQLLNDVSFPVGVIHGEDFLFNLQYLTKCKSGILNQTPFYNYLKRSNSVTTSKFSENKITEIRSKDMALEIVKTHKPSQMNNARKICFRARMNVLRGIYKANKETEYSKEISDIEKYIKLNFSKVKTTLKLKEKTEYLIYVYLKPIYKFLTGM